MRDIKEAIKNGVKPVGTFIWDLPAAVLPKVFANAGYDYVILDNEHGCFSYETLLNMVQIARGSDIVALIRVPKIDRECIQRYWDMGADGIIVPMVNTAEQAAEAVALSKYAPMGRRGLAFQKGNMDYHVDGDPVAYMKYSNEKGLILVQCETVESAKNIDSILAVNGVDGIFFGPLDMSGDMGKFGRYGDAVFKDTASRVMKAARAAGKIAAAFVGDLDSAADRLREGANMLAWGTETAMLFNAAKRDVGSIRALEDF